MGDTALGGLVSVLAFAVGLGVQGPGKGFQGYEWELCKKKSDLNPWFG